jgi:hypothetical protein
MLITRPKDRTPAFHYGVVFPYRDFRRDKRLPKIPQSANIAKKPTLFKVLDLAKQNAKQEVSYEEKETQGIGPKSSLRCTFPQAKIPRKQSIPPRRKKTCFRVRFRTSGSTEGRK